MGVAMVFINIIWKHVLSFSGAHLQVLLNKIKEFGLSSLYRLSHLGQHQVSVSFLLRLAHSKCHQPCN